MRRTKMQQAMTPTHLLSMSVTKKSCEISSVRLRNLFRSLAFAVSPPFVAELWPERNCDLLGIQAHAPIFERT